MSGPCPVHGRLGRRPVICRVDLDGSELCGVKRQVLARLYANWIERAGPAVSGEMPMCRETGRLHRKGVRPWRCENRKVSVEPHLSNLPLISTDAFTSNLTLLDIGVTSKTGTSEPAREVVLSTQKEGSFDPSYLLSRRFVDLLLGAT